MKNKFTEMQTTSSLDISNLVGQSLLANSPQIDECIINETIESPNLIIQMCCVFKILRLVYVPN